MKKLFVVSAVMFALIGARTWAQTPAAPPASIATPAAAPVLTPAPRVVPAIETASVSPAPPACTPSCTPAPKPRLVKTASKPAIREKAEPASDIKLDSTASTAVGRSRDWLTAENRPTVGDDGRVMFTYGAGLPVVVCAPLRMDRLKFDYSLEGDAACGPVRVLDNGAKTYIQLPATSKADEIPVLVVLNAEGKEQLVNSRFINGWYEVDRLFDRAALILGVGGEQRKIVITNNARYKSRSSFWNFGSN